MKFKIKTLIDITETRARKGDDPLLAKQQANFMTLYNTIGLRTNATDFKLDVKKEDVSKLFGSSFKGKKTVWTAEFYVEAEDSLSVDMMLDDFDLVPFITDLTEDSTFSSSVFRTQDPAHTNIIFEQLDK
jgi:hypothetical protein